MSALGQKQTLHRSNRMSALPPIADIPQRRLDVRFVPKADSCTAAKGVLLDHPVSACHQTRRHCHTHRIGRLEINYQLKLRRLFHRNVGDLGSAEELNQLSGIKSAHDLSETRPVGSKAAFLSGFGPLIHSRQPLRSDTL